MEHRATELGYSPIQPGELDYVAVPGFAPPEPTILKEAQDVTEPDQTLPPDYSQSLIEWFDQRMQVGGTR